MKPSRSTAARAAATTVAAALAIAAGPSPAGATPPTTHPAPVPTTFSSSFEAADAQPTWTDTIDTDRAGRERAAGVDGTVLRGIPGSVSDQVTAIAASGEYTEAREVKENLNDADPATKWLVFTATAWVSYTLAEPVRVVTYALTSANDAAERDPRDWTMEGSDNGTDWTVVDTRTGESFAQRQLLRTFEVAEPGSYRHYRLNVAANHSGSIIQLADLQLSNGDTSTPPPSPMHSRIESGPTSSPTAKAGVGYSGLKAFGVSGRQLVDGRAYSYNKVYDTDIRVTAETELSYVVFPEFVTGDLTYPSTYVAVDLAFTDGTYLSDLGAVDQHGTVLSPTAQGRAKMLSTAQWNSVRSRIGQVAAGKRIDRILVGYDKPSGPATTFRAWFDDLRIGAVAPAKSGHSLASYVETRRGTQSSSSYSRGNNFPATAVPHGFNFWTPVTNAGTTSWLYEYHRANNADNLPTIQAFSASHEPSPWMGDRQTFQVMPADGAGVPAAGRTARALPFQHANETALPHYYAVTFENGLRTEIAPTDHAAMFRFTFAGDTSNLIFDNVDGNAGLTIDATGGVITGWSDVRSGLSTGATRMFMYATVDRPITTSGMLPTGNRPSTGYVQFDTGAAKTVTMRIATSLISVDQARHNLELEIAPADTLETVRKRAESAWNERLGTVEVEGASADQLTTLYSNLYRLFLYPNSAFENTGTARRPVYRHAVQSATSTPASTPTETGAPVKDGKVYVNNGFWDTYRTTWPAYTLLTPTEAGEMIDGFVQQYRDGGWISRWSSPGYADLMVGTSSDVAFADAYLKGIRNFDIEGAYQAAVKNASVAPPNSNVGRKGMKTSVFKGYTPYDATGEALSWAMDGYINDFGLANFAAALAAKGGPDAKRYAEDAAYYRNRALNYVNMFDPQVSFFQGKNSAGEWRWAAEDYDPRVWGYDYTETDGWNMAFHAPQDGQGLANLYGGRDGLEQKLDTFFSTQETATFGGSYGGTIHEMTEARDVRMGQYGHSNQPSHHIAYMYDFAGAPAKTQAAVREITSRLYLGSEIGQGYAGDEDNGEMSAWYVFSALGFYPLQMGSPNYAIGSPLFSKATVHLENGRSIVINARNNSASNVYVQSLRVNGQRYDKTYLPHSLLSQGATLDFTMGPRPSTWGTSASAAPPSLTKGSQVAQPLADAAAPGRGTPTAGADTPAAALFDDTSATQVTLAASAPSVGFQFTGDAPRVEQYTLTSGTVAGDPTGWRLLGSTDGVSWKTLDRRSDQSFDWRSQTRAFTIAHPGRYAYYRLDFTGGTDEAITVSEVEFLAPPATAVLPGLTAGAAPPDNAAPSISDGTADGTVAPDAAGRSAAPAPGGSPSEPAPSTSQSAEPAASDTPLR